MWMPLTSARPVSISIRELDISANYSDLSVWTLHALDEHKERTDMTPKNTICLWFNKDAHEAARFYAATFPDSKVIAVHTAPSDYPSGKAGDELTVEFTVLGIPCLGLNGGPQFRHSEAFSFQIATDTQEETDRYWNAIVGNGGKESQCGWCKERWGLTAVSLPCRRVELIDQHHAGVLRRRLADPFGLLISGIVVEPERGILRRG